MVGTQRRVETRAGAWRRAALAAGMEARASRLFYLQAVLFSLAGGLLALLLAGPVFGDGGSGPAAAALDGLFVLSASLVFYRTGLAERFQREYPSSGRLTFLKSLPLSSRELVAGHALALALGLAAVAIAFLAPPALSALGALLGLGGYLMLAGIWTGYAFALTGVTLLLDFIGGRISFAVTVMIYAAIGLGVGYLHGGGYAGLVERAVRAVEAGGSSVPGIVIAGGLAVFAACGAAAVAVLSRKDLSG